MFSLLPSIVSGCLWFHSLGKATEEQGVWEEAREQHPGDLLLSKSCLSVGENTINLASALTHITKHGAVMSSTLYSSLDVFSLGGLLSYFRPSDDTLENSCFQIFK